MKNRSDQDFQEQDQLQRMFEDIHSETLHIDSVMRLELERLTSGTDALLQEVIEYALFNGGKRIRPLLTVLCARLCGRNDDDVYRLGCAFEFLHVATLMHDDVIDNSLMRRGKKAVYQKFGMIAAILAGDFLHAAAMAIVGELAGKRGLEVFCRATTGMVDGEFMQLRNANNLTLSKSQYYHAIMGKTGPLISEACEIGAMFGHGNISEVAALREYGEHLGCAFQIVDDLLDYLGDPAKTGKQVGNDLLEGKITLPLILAIEAGNAKERERILELLRNEELRQDCFREVSAFLHTRGGFDIARKQAQEEVQTGLQCLQCFKNKPQDKEREILTSLLHYVLVREK